MWAYTYQCKVPSNGLATNESRHYSKVPNKRIPPCLFFLKKKSDTPPPTPPLLLGPSRLLIFGFSSPAPKKIEQCKTYLQ